MTICILGRQPALGLAELEALYGSARVRTIGTGFAMVAADIEFSRLGGSVKAAMHMTTLDTVKPEKVFDYCRKVLSKQLENLPEGKLKLGVSLYGYSLPVSKINAHSLSLKKVLRDTGRSVRVVPNTEPALSSAQTYHNQLTSPLGMELVFIRDGDKTLLGQVTHVQDIDAYRRRDQERPKRDAYVGMLPPKLAQIIVNLAAGDKPDGVVLDPFCGTGVLLQEAALIGYEVYGTDIEERMVRFSRDNLNWLKGRSLAEAKADTASEGFAPPAKRGKTNNQLAPSEPDKSGKSFWFGYHLETADATDHIWRKPIDIVACEGYLGHPFANEPGKEALQESIQTAGTIMKKFLRNIAGQLEPGTRLCIAFPAWHVKNKDHHLSVLGELEMLGFCKVKFKSVKDADLIYRRTGQVVGRELVVLTKT